MDLIGQRFGRLTVLYKSDDPYITKEGYKIPRWVCRCDCGNTTVVLQSSLTKTKNGTRSCGCIQKTKTRERAVDMTGQRFGRLTVVCPEDLDINSSNKKRAGWRCRCDCGKEIVVPRRKLIEGLQSCGCLSSDVAREKVKRMNETDCFSDTSFNAINPTRKMNRNNTSGVRGVFWSNGKQRWVAIICVCKKRIYLGQFKDFDEAVKARKRGEEEYFAPLIEEYNSARTDKNRNSVFIRLSCNLESVKSEPRTC